MNDKQTIEFKDNKIIIRKEEVINLDKDEVIRRIAEIGRIKERILLQNNELVDRYNKLVEEEKELESYLTEFANEEKTTIKVL